MAKTRTTSGPALPALPRGASAWLGTRRESTPPGPPTTIPATPRTLGPRRSGYVFAEHMFVPRRRP